MTILTHTKTFYDYEAHRLSRAIDNSLCFINLTDKVSTIKAVHRLCHLDNESFKLMAQLQANKAKRAKQ